MDEEGFKLKFRALKGTFLPEPGQYQRRKSDTDPDLHRILLTQNSALFMSPGQNRSESDR